MLRIRTHFLNTNRAKEKTDLHEDVQQDVRIASSLPIQMARNSLRNTRLDYCELNNSPRWQQVACAQLSH